jgi:serine/threonine protein kinase
MLMLPSALVPGAVIDGFRIGERLHAGGMATLFEAERKDINSPLVMKVPIVDTSDPLAIVGFEMEQMILPLLKGPHVPKVFAMGEFAAQPYIVMERIAGRSITI